MVIASRRRFAFLLVFIGLSGAGDGFVAAETVRSYTIEGLNDLLFDAYPPPPPATRRRREFDVEESSHVEEIAIGSTRLRTLSIRIENLGSALIRKPYIFGPHGWDFRSLEAIAASITSDSGLTKDEKFIRVHEWTGLHMATVLGGSSSPYNDLDFSSNPLRNLNQYGHGMCGQMNILVNSLLRVVPPIGSMYGRNVKLESHRAGEGWWDGAWHAFDATMGIGLVPWIFYKSYDRTMAPGWRYLIDRPELVSQIEPITNATTYRYLDDATGESYGENRSLKAWDFNYDLRPGESLTMYPDMRGRLDRKSAKQDNSDRYRDYSDYGSAVFRYEPDFTNDTYAPYVRQSNVRRTSSGLVPSDSSKQAYVILEMKSTWCFAGADVRASFKSDGSVYVGVRSNPYDTAYSSSGISWKLLSSSTKEYGSYSIEGKMAYWLKFVFQGSGSGLNSVRVDSEVQMSPWSMPRLEPGLNRIRFKASSLGSPARVTYEYDDESPFHTYEVATDDYGRHIPVRVGGILHRGSKASTFDHGKGRFWDRLNDSPGTTISTKVEIYRSTGDGAFERVRTLVSKSLKPGWYTFFWNGKNDSGARLPWGMYAYKLSFGGKLFHGERLYLFEDLWPVPNEPVITAAAIAAAEPFQGATGPDPVLAEPVPDLEPESAAVPLRVEKLSARLRFDVDRRSVPCFADTAFIRIALPGIASGWDPAGKALRVNLGGAEAEFLLDRAGRGRGPMGRVQLGIRRSRAGAGDVVARIVLRGSWADEWADEGVSPGENDGGSRLEIPVRIDLEGTEFAGGAGSWMTSRPGKGARIVLD